VRQTLRFTFQALASLALLALGLWTGLALSFLTAMGLAAMAVTGLAILLALSALWLKKPWAFLPLIAISSIALFLFVRLTPSADRQWAPDVAYLATGYSKGDELTLNHVRQFRWRDDTQAEPQWTRRHYNLNDLASVDLIASYWMGEAIAHTMLSFGFKNPDGRVEHLVFSTEIRKEQHESYSALAGFFRRYELAIIAADEPDIIGVRAQFRNEDVRIYPLTMTKATARQLLLRQIAYANKLAKKPQFYNTLTANCTTLPFQMARILVPGLPLDWRILASGYFPDYLYDIGAMPKTVPFDQMRALAPASERAQIALSDSAKNFSTTIRMGLPQADLF
jgi:Domain of unknown function (DUF4105)